MDKKVFFGGSIITMNDNQPTVQALGIEGEKICFVGNLEEIKKNMGNNYKSVNLDGRTILPGFIDSHMHPIYSIFHTLYLNLSDVKSLGELKKLLKETAEKKKPDELIFALDLREENFDNPILPTRWDIDEVCPNHPVALLRHDGHLIVTNSKALELAQIDKNTISTEAGEIKKDEDGEPNGILTENATALILSKIPNPDTKTIQDAVIKTFKGLAAKGLTSLHGFFELDRKGGVENLGGISIPILRTFKEYILQNFYGVVFTAKPKKLLKLKTPPLDEGKIDGKFKIGGLKIWADGSFGSSTCYMFEPFHDQPNNSGFLMLDEEEMYKRMKEAHNLGFQIAIHAIGDRGNRIVVDLYKKLLKEYPRDNHRHRIEHASLLTDDIIKDIKELDLIASCQPPFIYSDCPFLEARLGKERLENVYPFKSIIDAGIILAAGSDGPIEDPSPILGLQAMVTREGYVPQECVSIENALKAYTINGAYTAFEENVKGSLEVGKLADLVILDKNPLEVPKNEIRNIEVMETIIRGKTVYKKE